MAKDYQSQPPTCLMQAKSHLEICSTVSAALPSLAQARGSAQVPTQLSEPVSDTGST